jgi:hypothetical protein
MNSEPSFDADKLIDAMSAFTGVPVDDAYRPGVAAHLIAARAIAAGLLALDLPDDAEPAPVFEP